MEGGRVGGDGEGGKEGGGGRKRGGEGKGGREGGGERGTEGGRKGGRCTYRGWWRRRVVKGWSEGEVRRVGGRGQGGEEEGRASKRGVRGMARVLKGEVRGWAAGVFGAHGGSGMRHIHAQRQDAGDGGRRRGRQPTRLESEDGHARVGGFRSWIP